MRMTKQFKNEVLKLKNKKHVDQDILKKFIDRINKGVLCEEENLENHFGCCILPLDPKTRQIFIGHHIKAGEWIGPGGHIEQNETPIETVKREFFEELKHELDKEYIELFDLTITDKIKTPRKCKIHYDIWYIVYVDKIDFDFDKGEFYKAQWMSIKESLKIMKRENHKNTIRKLDLVL